jgi:hypothetical protein
MRAGFALLEVILASALVGMVLLALTKTIQSSQTSAQLTTAHHTLAMKLARTVETMRRELSFAALSTCRAVPGGGPVEEPMAEGTAYDNISFRPVTSFVGATPQYGDTIRFSLLPERGEVIDGVDNDRDGIVDERMLVRTIGGVGTTTLSGVTAFSVMRNGENLTVSVQVTARNQMNLIVKNASLTTSIMNN